MERYRVMSWLGLFGGVIILCIGFYLNYEGISSQGVTTSKSGGGAGSISGNGAMFCGCLALLFSSISFLVLLFNRKSK